MKKLSLMVLVAAASVGPLHAQTGFSNSVESPKVDAFGCSILPRPERYTFTTFKDAWRSVAADRLYGLTRHQKVVEADTCTCDLLHPDWTSIDAAAAEIGVFEADRPELQAWAAKNFFPKINGLTTEVRKLCEGGA
ncbi:hypothetical protein SAMN05444413_101503 [Roseivivax marinus]|uniref:hypothetical protein n=1 Tax=Roseivivax marinus TaxID=1379903 RepID=UPI0008D26AF3|nr:hypothetical protein [Roseivivax marinus]SEK40038.1 hypothetical protein SAMN05444413_101503 [Roseivivax marinus]